MNNKTTSSAEETQELGKEFVGLLKPQDVIALHGELGAGKTTFVKGIAAALGIESVITSPTFTIVKSYNTTHPTIKKLYHLDLYRLEENTNINSLGLNEMIYDKNGIVIIEWPEKATITTQWDIYFEEQKDNKRTVKIDRTS